VASVNVLIVDDEPLARKELRRLLAKLADVTVVGEAANADEAEAELARCAPDVLLLDIEMPGATGFDLLARLPLVPPVIFTTAYDDYAVRAFEVNALDYVVKPIELDRLASALAKVTTRSDAAAIARVFVRDGARCWLVPLHEVRLIASDGNYVRLFWGAREILLARSLTTLAPRLDPRAFFRANRREIINLAMVERVHPPEAVGSKCSCASARSSRCLAAKLVACAVRSVSAASSLAIPTHTHATRIDERTGYPRYMPRRYTRKSMRIGSAPFEAGS
jgi:two-component system LytT family response regulator